MNRTSLSNLGLYATLIALALIALAGVLIVQPGPESTQRLGLLFGILGTGVAAIVAVIRSDQAASRLNGGLDDRIQSGVMRANSARRASDIVPDSERIAPDTIDPVSPGKG